MLHNNLDPDVAERPEDLIVYGGLGKAARNWEAFDTSQPLHQGEALTLRSQQAVRETAYKHKDPSWPSVHRLRFRLHL